MGGWWRQTAARRRRSGPANASASAHGRARELLHRAAGERPDERLAARAAAGQSRCSERAVRSGILSAKNRRLGGTVWTFSGYSATNRPAGNEPLTCAHASACISSFWLPLRPTGKRRFLSSG